MSMFEISDKVVCVNDKERPTDPRFHQSQYRYPGGMIEKGKTYCVAAVLHHPTSGKTGIILVGYPMLGTDANGVWKEAGWSPHRFRKVQAMKAEADLKAREK